MAYNVVVMIRSSGKEAEHRKNKTNEDLHVEKEARKNKKGKGVVREMGGQTRKTNLDKLKGN